MSTIPSAKDIQATVQFLKQYSPFNQMTPEHLTRIASRAKLNFYAKDHTIIASEHIRLTHVLIIKDGSVLCIDHENDESHYAQGDMFPLETALAKAEITNTFIAESDVFCFELPIDDFDELLTESLPLQNFCTRKISALLEHSRKNTQAHYAYFMAEQQSMNAPLSSIIRFSPIVCTPETPIRYALQIMQNMSIGAIIITDATNHPLGIFTLHDVLSRIALVHRNLDDPISTIMSTALITLPSHALAYEAALLMIRRNIRHVLVVNDGILTGIISERDLFALQRVGLRQISSMIHKAGTVETLIQASKDIRQLARNMLAQGVASEQLTQLISTLNDILTEKIIEIHFEKYAKQLKDLRVCWLTFGSEGRFEQTLSTDQDNGLIFVTPEHKTPDEVREILIPICREINEMLDQCGFPLCKGNIMASNPELCLSLEEWKENFNTWIHKASAQELLNAVIYFDLRGSFGEVALAHELRDSLNNTIKQNNRFLKEMVLNALANKSPLGMIRDFTLSNNHTIDLKMNGVGQFIDCARIMALHAGVHETNTARRLRSVGKKWNLESGQVEAWIEAFHFIQTIRLKLHDHQIHEGIPTSNKLNPDTLNDLDRRILKEAFQQSRKLQSKVEKMFQF